MGSKNGAWRNVALALLSVVLVLIGAFFGDLAASLRYRNLTEALQSHAVLPGHPVMVERVDDIRGQLDKIEKQVTKNGEMLTLYMANSRGEP